MHPDDVTGPAGIRVLFVSGFGPITANPDESRAFYKDTLGLPLETMPGGPSGYWHTEALDGVRHFAVWPLAEAAKSCFGHEVWPADVRVPNAWIEFDVEDVASAATALEKQGYRMLVRSRQEPWGQTVSRLLSPEGLLVGLVITPWLR